MNPRPAIAVRPARRAALLAAALALAVSSSVTARAGEVTVAVAANFASTLDEAARAFEDATGHTVVASPGATGALYTRIVQGAPYDVFLAADPERPARLAEAGLADAPFTYAVGRLVAWSPDDGVDVRAALRRPGRIAIANPATAPYGVAALEALRALGLADDLEGRLVRGQNVAQAFQFAATGNARLAFVGPAQLPADGSGSAWVVPERLYAPLRQDGVILRRAADPEAAAAFVAWLLDEDGRRLVLARGYALP